MVRGARCQYPQQRSTSMNQPKILLIGAGGHCRACIDVIRAEGRFSIAGVVERDGAAISEDLLGCAIMGTDQQLPELRRKYDYALVTVGQMQTASLRVRIYEHLQSLGFDLPMVCSPRAYVSPHAVVGSGTIIMHDALVNVGARIGDNCIINTKALVEHDAVVESHCHISTGAILNGGATVGTKTFFGSNAVSVQGASIRAESFIKAGTLEKGL